LRAELLQDGASRRRFAPPHQDEVCGFKLHLLDRIGFMESIYLSAFRSSGYVGWLSQRAGSSRLDGVTHRYPPALPLRLAVGYAVQVGCSQPTCTANPPYYAAIVIQLHRNAI
jgi:hypothetical protein